VGEDVGDLGFRGVAVDRDGDKVELQGGQEGGDEVDRVRELDGQGVTRAHPGGGELGGELAGPGEERGPGGDGPGFRVDEREREGVRGDEGEEVGKHRTGRAE